MGQLRRIFTELHTKTRREYLPRMVDDKVACMRKAKEYGFDYWDGDRRFGYGGYRYDGRWKPVAERFIAAYGLTDSSSVLDVGCGKAFLLHEMKALLPGLSVAGLDISAHALAEARPEVKPFLFQQRAQDLLPFADKSFDLVFSLNTLHNLEVFDLKRALSEIERVGRQKYLCVESYRDEQELFNLQCWALTCESFFSAKAWPWLFERFGYSGDYEFIYFQ